MIVVLLFSFSIFGLLYVQVNQHSEFYTHNIKLSGLILLYTSAVKRIVKLIMRTLFL